MAQNPFDGLSDRVFDACDATMGYDASWTPSDLSPVQTGRILFGEPTRNDILGNFGDSFNPQTYFMEYWFDNFTGLFDSVRSNNDENIVITFDTGDRTFFVRHIERKYDGKNYRAQIEEVL